MSKVRHIKSVQEKYGTGSVMDEVLSVLHSKNRWKEDFDKLPYLGIVYLDNQNEKIREDLIYYFETADISTETITDSSRTKCTSSRRTRSCFQSTADIMLLPGCQSGAS